jgi:hypothetical protein
LGSNIRQTLSRAAPECAAILFEHINRLTSIARATELDKLYEESMTASNLAGRLAIKTIEMTVGKQLNISATVTNQTSVPNWNKLPKDVQQRFIEALASIPEAEVVGTVIEGEVVPQTDEAYHEENPHDETHVS